LNATLPELESYLRTTAIAKTLKHRTFLPTLDRTNNKQELSCETWPTGENPSPVSVFWRIGVIISDFHPRPFHHPDSEYNLRALEVISMTICVLKSTPSFAALCHRVSEGFASLSA
jgi:hypothetical protein